MGIDNVSQLPEDLQQAAAPVAPGANAVPLPALPLANSVPQQPDGQVQPDANPPTAAAIPAAPASPATSPFVTKMHEGMNIAAANTPPASQSTPGNWARQILAGVTHAFGGVQDALGDAATAAQEGPNYGGIAGAVGRIHNAETARKQQQQTFQTQQQKDQATIAATNVQTMYHQTLLHQLSDELNDKDITQGKAKLASMTTDLAAHHLQPGQIIAPDITESQLQKAVADKSWDPTKEIYMATGSFEVPGKEDDQGNPLKQKLYTIVAVPTEQVLNQDQINRINKYVPGVHFDFNPDKPNAVKIPGAQALSLITSAEIAETAENHRDQELEDAKLKKLDSDAKIAADEAGMRILKNPDYLKANSQAKGNLQGIYDYLVHTDRQSAGDLMIYYGGPKNFATIVDKQNEDLETARHNKAMEAEKKVEDIKKQNESGSWSLQEKADGVPVLLNSKNGQTMPAPAGVQARGTKSKQDAAFQKESEPAIAALGYANSYLSNGVFTGSGDEALQEKFFELAKPTTGFRMSQPQMDMLQNSRSWMQSAGAKKQHASQGTWFTPDQRKEIVATMQTLANSKLQVLHAAGQPTATTHVFNAQSWAAANPGKDVNAAIAAAKVKGYQVKQ